MQIEVKKPRDIANDFLNMLISTIERTTDEKERSPSKSFKPSSMNCSRRCYYHLIQEEEGCSDARGYQLIGMGESGTARHEYLQFWTDQMKNFHYPVEYIDIEEYLTLFPNDDIEVIEKRGVETLLHNKKYNMRFLVDGIVKIYDKYYIIEYKTEISFKHNRREGVDPGHFNQATAYYLNFHLPILFIYESRDNLSKKAYLFKPTPDDIATVLRTMEEANKGVAVGKVPPIPQNINDSLDSALTTGKVSMLSLREGRWQLQLKDCQYCEFQQNCMSEEKENVDIPNE